MCRRPPLRLPAPGIALLASLALACGGTEPPVPTEIALTPGTISLTALGETVQLTAAVSDQHGDPIEAEVTWSSSDETVASVSPAGLVTAQGPGQAEITASAGGATGTAPASVTQEVASLQPVAGNAQAGVAGRTLPEPLVVAAEDARGNPIPGLVLAFTVTQGGGQVSAPQATTDAAGKATVTYTLGATPGSAQQVTVGAEGSAITATFNATATPPPASIRVFAGNGQSAGPGAAVPVAPAVRVLDAQDQPVPGVAVRFQVGRGAGTVPPGVKLTNANGVATADQWTLGPSGVNTLEASVDEDALAGEPALFVATTTPAQGFDVSVRYTGNPTSSQILAFAEAEVRWEQVITGDLSDGTVDEPGGVCGPGTPPFTGTVDDLVIFAGFVPIDGPFNILAQAGPCLFRDNNGNGQLEVGDLPGAGIMFFDVDDLEFMEQTGLLTTVVLHEMGHVLGIGSLWEVEGLLADPSLPNNPGADPHFTGAQAVAAFDEVGGAAYVGGKVPVEDTGGPGTADVHWRESVFDNELMTGIVNQSNPLSTVTIASLADQGYQVDVGQADAFTLPSGLRIAADRPSVRLPSDVLRLQPRRLRPK
jgi:hypothetical protein